MVEKGPVANTNMDAAQPRTAHKKLGWAMARFAAQHRNTACLPGIRGRCEMCRSLGRVKNFLYLCATFAVGCSLTCRTYELRFGRVPCSGIIATCSLLVVRSSMQRSAPKMSRCVRGSSDNVSCCRLFLWNQYCIDRSKTSTCFAFARKVAHGSRQETVQL